MDLRILGAREFFLLAADCRDAARRDLERELIQGLDASVQPVTQAIRSAAGRQMPHSGGYAGVLTAALRITPRRQSATGIRLQVTARGAKELRDVPRLDAGQLRHPVYGRSRRIRRGRRAGTVLPNPWATTRVPPGFATRTFEQQADQVVDRLSQAVQAVADKIAGD